MNIKQCFKLDTKAGKKAYALIWKDQPLYKHIDPDKIDNFIKDLEQQAKKAGKNLDEYLDELLETRKLNLLGKVSDEAIQTLKIMADEALKWQSKKRPQACSVLEGKGKQLFNYSFKQKLPAGKFPKDLHPLVDKWVKDKWELHKKGKIKLPEHHGKCAEVKNISEYLKQIDPQGKFTMIQAKEAFEGFVSHARQIGDRRRKGVVTLPHKDYKKACDSCIDILEDFNINEYKID